MKANMYKYLLTGFLVMGIFAAHAQTLGGDNPCKPIKILGPNQSDGSLEETYVIQDQFGCGTQGYRWQYSGALSVNGQMVSNAGGTGSLITNDNTLLVRWNANAQNAFLKAQSVDPCGRRLNCLDNGGDSVRVIVQKTPIQTQYTFSGEQNCIGEGIPYVYSLAVKKAGQYCNCGLYTWKVYGGRFTDQYGNAASGVLNMGQYEMYMSQIAYVYIVWNSVGNGFVSVEASNCCLSGNSIYASKTILESAKSITQSSVGNITYVGESYSSTCPQREFRIDKPTTADKVDWHVADVPKHQYTATDYSTYSVLRVNSAYMLCSTNIKATVYKSSCAVVKAERNIAWSGTFAQPNSIKLISGNNCSNADKLEFVLEPGYSTSYFGNDQYFEWSLPANSPAVFLNTLGGTVSQNGKRYSSQGSSNVLHAVVEPNGTNILQLNVDNKVNNFCYTTPQPSCYKSMEKLFQLSNGTNPKLSYTINHYSSEQDWKLSAAQDDNVLIMDGSASREVTMYAIEIFKTDAVNSTQVTGAYYMSAFQNVNSIGRIPYNINLKNLYATVGGSFDRGGIYRIKLIAKNSCTQWEEESMYISIVDGEGIGLSPRCGTINQLVQFNVNNNILPDDRYTWELFFNFIDRTDIPYAFGDIYQNIISPDLTIGKFGIVGDYYFVIRDKEIHYDGQIYPNRYSVYATDEDVKIHCGEIVFKTIQQEEPKVEVIPNPSTGVLQIHTENLPEKVFFEVYDTNGKTVYRGYEKEIKLGEIPSGIYFLRSMTDGFKDTQKILIQK